MPFQVAKFMLMSHSTTTIVHSIPSQEVLHIKSETNINVFFLWEHVTI